MNLVSLVEGMTDLLVARSWTSLATSLTASSISSNSAIALNSVVAASCMPSLTSMSTSAALTDNTELINEFESIRGYFTHILIQLCKQILVDLLLGSAVRLDPGYEYVEVLSKFKLRSAGILLELTLTVGRLVDLLILS